MRTPTASRQTATIACPLCNGYGGFRRSQFEDQQCAECHGRGWRMGAARAVRRLAQGRMALDTLQPATEVTCAQCGGKGQVSAPVYEQCAMCRGIGRILA